MFEIYEITGTLSKHVLATAETFADAKAKVTAMGVYFLEDDPDHADCADAYMKDGRIVSVQPKDFVIA